MNKQPLFPCPVSLHSSNGFDIARQMKCRPSRKCRKVGKVQPKKNSMRKYIVQTVPGKSGNIVFKVKRTAVNYKLALAAGLGMFFSCKNWFSNCFSDILRYILS